MGLLHKWQLTEINHERQRAAQQERKKVMEKGFSMILDLSLPHRGEHFLAKEIDDVRLVRHGNVHGYVHRSQVGELAKRLYMVLGALAHLPVLVDCLKVYLRLTTPLDVKPADVVKEAVLPCPRGEPPFLGGVTSLGIASHDRPVLYDYRLRTRFPT